MDLSLLLQQSQAGDPHAFGRLVQRYEGPLFGYLGRMGLGPQAAEEVAQETFLRAWAALPRFDPGRGPFSTWLFCIARNLALNALSRSSTWREDRSVPLPDPASPEPGPSDRLVQAQERRRLTGALQRLSPSDRSVLALAYVDELDHQAIARIEGCSVDAVKTRLSRARRRLREIWEEENRHDP